MIHTPSKDEFGAEPGIVCGELLDGLVEFANWVPFSCQVFFLFEE